MSGERERRSVSGVAVRSSIPSDAVGAGDVISVMAAWSQHETTASSGIGHERDGDCGPGRRAAVEQLSASTGGKLESFYFTFGADDFVIVVDLPDNEAAAAVAMTVGASGAVDIRTTVLLTTEQIDAVARRVVDYRAPGS
jgi:uncharacterized protein with GYD domain